MNPVGGAGSSPAAPATDDQRLRDAAHALEGVFLSHMYAAMRQTVPEGGLLPSNPAADTFTSFLDDEIARAAAERSERGLGHALYLQLRQRLGATPDE